MVLPPPNVTGKLHLGHALTIIIEDAMCRHHRIKGGIEVDRVNISPDSFLMIPAQNGGKRSVRVGVMHRIRYPLLNSTKFVEVGTTRPETIFADVALAVNPCDTRYSNLIGKRVLHPLIQGRELPILADEAVIMDKGTGILKITPSHDYLDYEIASRHWDEILCIDPNAKNRHCFDESGRITISNFKNMDRFDGREKVIQILEELNLYCGEMSYCSGQIAVCSRTGDIIEPRLTEQWFMNTSGMYEDTEKAIKDGRIKIDPIGQEQRLFDWLSNKDPWCLSRQLFWGHRIPAYKTEGSPWIIAKSLEEARKRLNTSAVLQQDNDVLDTWFSSSLVPLVTSGWMEGTLDVSKPLLNIMETGWDILGFWVARMIAMTIRLTGGQVPFPRVVLHGLIRDSNGQKMSKSLGNVIDPLDIINGIQQSEMIERLERSFLNQNEIVSAIADIRSRFPEGIPQSGADALRFALLRHDVLASDIPLNIADLAGEGLRFCNKLWNLIAYVETVSAKSLTQKDVDSENPAVSFSLTFLYVSLLNQVASNWQDLWILSRLAACLQQVDSHMEECNPHLAFSGLHTFILSNLCDVYLVAR
uniref:valine--tRNA ligase n=1 Tax=Heterorhabditis bacteriophora TaxID=37862 RepID=A0A1I7XLR2_HETBA